MLKFMETLFVKLLSRTPEFEFERCILICISYELIQTNKQKLYKLLKK